MQILDNKDRVGGLLILAFAVAYLRYALVLPLDPTDPNASFTSRTLPVGLAVASIVFAVVQLAMSFRGGSGGSIREAVRGYRWRPMLLLLVLMLSYSLMFQTLGFLVSSFAFLLLGFFIMGERRIILSVVVAGGLVTLLWVLLTQAFGLFLDPGDLMRAIVGSAG